MDGSLGITSTNSASIKAEMRAVSPALAAIHATWEEAAGDGLPNRHAVLPDRLVRHLHQIELIDVDCTRQDFRYRVLGSWFDAISRQPYTGQWCRDIPGQGPGSTLWSMYERAVQERVPVISTVPYVGHLPGLTAVSALLMPLSSDGCRVDLLLGAIDFWIDSPLPATITPSPIAKPLPVRVPTLGNTLHLDGLVSGLTG